MVGPGGVRSVPWRLHSSISTFAGHNYLLSTTLVPDDLVLSYWMGFDVSNNHRLNRGLGVETLVPSKGRGDTTKEPQDPSETS